MAEGDPGRAFAASEHWVLRLTSIAQHTAVGVPPRALPTLGGSRRFGGISLWLGDQSVRVENGRFVPIDPDPSTGGSLPNRNPGCYDLNAVLKTGVRAHAQVAADFLSGA